VAAGGQAELTVTLSTPAPPGGVTVALSVSPAGAGTLPATISIPADQQAARFFYADGGTAASAAVTAALDASSASATVLAGTVGHLVINEVDYDQPGTDGAEFVELLNPTAAPVSLLGASPRRPRPARPTRRCPGPPQKTTLGRSRNCSVSPLLSPAASTPE
jgi:hypothetical protein